MLGKRDLVVFVGAGISIPPARDWWGLVKEVATRCGVTFRDDEPLPSVIDRCIARNRSASNKALREFFPKHIAATRTAIGYLHRLTFRAILTTNFDPWIRQQSRSQDYQRCYVYPHLPLGTGLEGGLYYLHGFFDSEDRDADIRDLVFGTSSFREAYEQSLLPGFLLQVFSYSNVLFVGFNPTEDNFQKILTQSAVIRRSLCSKSTSRSIEPERFVLWPEPTGTGTRRAEQSALMSSLRSLDIIPIMYSREGDDYRGLEDKLFRWVNLGDMKNRPAPFD